MSLDIFFNHYVLNETATVTYLYNKHFEQLMNEWIERNGKTPTPKEFNIIKNHSDSLFYRCCIPILPCSSDNIATFLETDSSAYTIDTLLVKDIVSKDQTFNTADLIVKNTLNRYLP